MRRLVKFLHTVGAIGMMGAIASLLVLLCFLPKPGASVTEYANMRLAMAGISDYVFLPSLVLTLISGLLAIASKPRLSGCGLGLGQTRNRNFDLRRGPGGHPWRHGE